MCVAPNTALCVIYPKFSHTHTHTLCCGHSSGRATRYKKHWNRSGKGLCLKFVTNTTKRIGFNHLFDFRLLTLIRIFRFTFYIYRVQPLTSFILLETFSRLNETKQIADISVYYFPRENSSSKSETTWADRQHEDAKTIILCHRKSRKCSDTV